MDAVVRRIALAEAVEQMGQEIRPDATPEVLHRQRERILLAPEGHPDDSTFLRELDGVGHQAPYDLAQARGIEPVVAPLRRQVELQAKLLAPPRRLAAERTRRGPVP